MTKIRFFVAALLVLCAMVPAVVSAQNFQLNAVLSASPSTPLSVGDTVTLTITVTNASSSNGGSGQAQVDLPSAFSFTNTASCNQWQITGGVFFWTSIPDTGGQLAPGQSAHCDIGVKMNSLPSPGNDSAHATIPATTFDPTPGNDTYQFNINYPTPTFQQPIAAAVNQQNVTLTWKTDGTTCATAGSSANALALPGWSSGTVCSGSTCGNASVALSNVPFGSYTFAVSCDSGGASASSSTNATVNPGAPSFSKALTASVNQQDVTLSFGATSATSCTGSSSPSVAAWAGTLCSSASACGNESTTLSGLAAGTYLFSVICSNAGGNTTSSTSAVVGSATALTDLSSTLSLPSGNNATRFAVGTTASFQLTVANVSSTNGASGVVANLQFPTSALSNVSSDVCGAPVQGQLNWNIGNLAGGKQVVCNIHGTVTLAHGAIPTSAKVMSNETDSDLSNNASNLIIQAYTPPKPVVAVTKPTTQDSAHLKLSTDGSMAVFESQETDLVANNTNTGGQDIYSAGADGKPVLETLDSSNHQLIGTSSLPAISGDGSIVAFTYAATAAKQAKDLTGQMLSGLSGKPKQQLDMGMGGTPPNGTVTGGPSVAVSSDGSKKLVFCSSASNLVANDTNNARDIFMVDPLNPGAGAQLISTDNNGAQLPGDSCEPVISADGTTVVFTISAPTLYMTTSRQVVSKNLITGELKLISETTTPGGPGADADSSEPTVNADGSVIAFTSKASNLDALGDPVGGNEVFVVLTHIGSPAGPGLIKRARNGDGTVPNGSSQHPQLSNDGTILVMQVAGSNFFSAAKADSSTTTCGTVALTTNFFTPAPVGSSLCTNNGQVSNTNPTISGDGTTTGFDSNAPQSGTSSSNNNVYTQGIAGTNALGVSNFSDDFSGQWLDPSQSGHGLVLDVFHPDAGNNRTMLLTWFVYTNGQPTWVQGSGSLHAGSGDQAGMVVVEMNPVGIFQGKTFPLGEAASSGVPWGSITLTFADANTGTMSWTSKYPGFNSGSMAITHFLPVALPAEDVAGAQITACDSGNWFNPGQSGHGFEFEILPAPPRLVVEWFAFSPTGAPVWLQGVGAISGDTAPMTLYLVNGSGAQFPPLFDASNITFNPWGTATFKFTNSTNASVTWNSTIAGYGSGTLALMPTFGAGLLDRRTCQ